MGLKRPSLIIASGISISPVIALLPLLLVVHFLFILGVGLIFCTANVFARDVRLLLDVILLGWMYATPIFYNITSVPEGVLRNIVRWNPMSILVVAERGVLMEHRLPDALSMAVVSAATLILLTVGLQIFNRNSRRFIDQL